MTAESPDPDVDRLVPDFDPVLPDVDQILTVDDLGANPRGARAYTLVGVALAICCLFFVPFLTGPLAMAFGTIGHVKQDPWGVRVAVLGGVAMVVGMALQALLFGSGGVAA